MKSLETAMGWLRMNGTGAPTTAPRRRFIPNAGLDAVIYSPTDKIDEEAYARLEKSIREVGMLQPIGVDVQNNLLFGRHRLEVFLRNRKADLAAGVSEGNVNARWGRISVVQFQDDLPPMMAEYLTLVENFSRKDMTTDQRQSATASLIRLRWDLKLEAEVKATKAKETTGNSANGGVSLENGNSAIGGVSPPKGKRGPVVDPWFADVIAASNQPEKTVRNWFADWRKSAGKSGLTPGKATLSDQAAFVAWLAAPLATAAEKEADETAIAAAKIKDAAAAIAKEEAEAEKRRTPALTELRKLSTDDIKAVVNMVWKETGEPGDPARRVSWQGKDKAA